MGSLPPLVDLMTSMWGIKILLLAGTMVGAFFIKNDFYQGAL
jgi:hypothetical protein